MKIAIDCAFLLVVNLTLNECTLNWVYFVKFAFSQPTFKSLFSSQDAINQEKQTFVKKANKSLMHD